MKGLIIYGIIVTTLLIGDGFLLVQKHKSNDNISVTNQIKLTNYVSVNTPHYINVSLTNTSVVIITNKGKIETNIGLMLSLDEYNKLMLIKYKYGMYVKSLIGLQYSNKNFILDHFENSNTIAIPQDLIDIFRDERTQYIGLGYSLQQSIHLEYGNYLFDGFGIGAFATLNIPKNYYDIGAEALYRFK